MDKFFIYIYKFFQKQKRLMWLILGFLSIVISFACFNLKYDEDITSFLPAQNKDVSKIFKRLNVSDKIAIIFSVKDNAKYDIQELKTLASDFANTLNANQTFSENAKINAKLDSKLMNSTNEFVYENLPFLLENEDYLKIEEALEPENFNAKMQSNFNYISSELGAFAGDFIFKDPLFIASKPLKNFEKIGKAFEYSIIDSYIFSKDKQNLICFASINKTSDKLLKNQILEVVEKAQAKLSKKFPNIDISYFSVNAVASANADVIRRDSYFAMFLAIIAISIVYYLIFRNLTDLFLIFVPAVFGILSSLAIIYFVKGQISIIAIGAGSITMGIALSYVIHFFVARLYCNNPVKLIEELSYPLSIGSFTTICAFAGLLFTNSPLLQDFGLFSSLGLFSTTIFILVFLPHFVVKKKPNTKNLKIFEIAEKVLLVFQNKKVIFSVLIIGFSLFCIVFHNEIKFNSNMLELSYMPESLGKAQEKLNHLSGIDEDSSTILFVVNAKDANQAITNYKNFVSSLDELKANGQIIGYFGIDKFLKTSQVQAEKLKRWKDFWHKERKLNLQNMIKTTSQKLGFEEESFDEFDELLENNYSVDEYLKALLKTPLFADWIVLDEDGVSIILHVSLENAKKLHVYDVVSKDDNVWAIDKAFFASMMVANTYENFNFMLYFCAGLVFFALLVSYGRLELAILAFMPMAISWIIIIGIMNLFKVEFNIITILLSTFIFGVGDDFSIFTMDGMLAKYKNNNNVLAQHKIAILLSAFTVIAGMGGLVFAIHPAMNSLGLISMIGMGVILFVSFTIQPFFFELFIQAQTKRGGFPFTIFGLLNSIYSFFTFLMGCIFIRLLVLILQIIPISLKSKKDITHRIVSKFCFYFLKSVPSLRIKYINDYDENFKKPAIIIANHQSFIDILILLGLNKKIVMLTKTWVWNSPFFGSIVRYLDFYNVDDGYDKIESTLRAKVEQGYSILVFPEGTRSDDCKIKRFHKGAFYLSKVLNLEILPILIYGNGLVSSKKQPFFIKNGMIFLKILERIPCDNADYQKTTKQISSYFKIKYDELYAEYNRTINPYFKDAIIKNYIYKGPLIEWYYRIKLYLENYYDRYDRILPRDGTIVDIGCGYGAMSYMLLMLSDKRKLISIDSDEEKIKFANNCFLKNTRIEFINADIRDYPLPSANAYIFSDVLHYMSYESQKNIITRCVELMNEEAMILVSRHYSTLSENLLEMFKELGLDLDIIESEKNTSNTLFVLKKKKVIL